MVKGYILSAGGHVRAAIYVRRALEAWLVEDYTDEDLAVCALRIEGRVWYIASLYMDIKRNVGDSFHFCRLVDFCEANCIPLVVGVDCNAHSPLWGCDGSNKRGEDLEELIMRCLAKDPEERFEDAAELEVALSWCAI